MTSITSLGGTSERGWTDALERISRLPTGGHQVLSVYVDLDPGRFPTPATRETELGGLLDAVRREGADADADRVAAWLADNPETVRGAHGLAIFACGAAQIFEVVRLPDAVEPLAVVDNVPWLEPLAEMASLGDWGVVVVSRRAARLFRGAPHQLVEFAHLDDDVYRRHSQGGWSQARFQRGTEEQVAAHVRRTIARVERAHERRPFAHLVLVASHELQPLITRSLGGELSGVLAGTVGADLEHASVREIAMALTPVVARAEREHERALVERIDQALTTGGPGASGLDEVLEMLEDDRVETLLVPTRSSLQAGVCATCGRLSPIEEGTCRRDGATLTEIDAIAHVVDEAARRSARVVVVRHESEWLHEHGDFAAILRW
jgi:peptide chain release factor subunit 1